MTVAWWDASVGAAGDMLLAAHLDAGADLGWVLTQLGALQLEDWALQLDTVHRGGLRALCASVEVAGSSPPRTWADIDAMLSEAPLPERVQRRARAVFKRLGEAEAHVHGVPLQAVHFHEVGAVDAIVDIVGTCLALEDLDVDEIIATPLPMGTGQITGSHGPLPLPAPATLQLATGWPTVPSPWPGEWVTPTATALITTLARPGAPPPMVVGRVGVGAGQRDPEQVANLCRVLLGTADSPRPDVVVVLQTNIDDLSGELLAGIVPRLLDTGALDAWITPILMKHGRPAHQVSALARPAHEAAVAAALLRHTSSLGLRRRQESRWVLDRTLTTVQTPWGEVRVKRAGLGEDLWHAAPEHRDVARLAASAGVSELEVHRAALVALAGQPD